MEQQRFDARRLNQRPRPRVSVVLSMLGAIAATAAWGVGVVTLFSSFLGEGVEMTWVFHATAVVVGVPLLWLWWRELLQPPVWPEPPDELDEPPRDHIGLHSDDPPPKRW